MDAIPAAEAAVYATLGSLFEIDDEGRVWRIGVMCNGVPYPCARRRAESRPGKRGYLQVRVVLDGKRLHVSAHRLVWMHFNGKIPAPAHLEINHDNGIKHDNRPLNLLLTTSSGNMRHAHATGLKDQRGQKNPASKLTDNQVAAIRTAYAAGDFTQAQLAEMNGVTFQCISKIVRGARRKSNLGATGDYTHRRKHSNIERESGTGRFQRLG